MPTIGAYVCKCATLLLLCSSTLAQGTNETAALEHSSVSSSPTSSGSTPSSSLSSTIVSSAFLPIAVLSSISTCQSRTINYITHTLPQQCLKTSWSASIKAASEAAASESSSSAGSETGEVIEPPKGTPSGSDTAETASLSSASDSISSTGSESAKTSSTPTPSSTATAEPEAETDSPLDNANFLSFEEWKKQNLARAGQSPENVGQGRGAASGNGGRRRPVNINNALDSLGEDAEIELDFGGFGNTGHSDEGGAHWASGTRDSNDRSRTSENGEGVAPSSRARSKDAGKTCKERFNYASFDCAATVLKTNQQCKSSSSVLVENKDSYMLNECAAQEKYIIVELCDDILIDTIVLANFEFFSSMFRTFRISVSDRYPVKLDRWRELGTFEARNSRDIQAFLVENPLVWARYLRVEFLTHYGNEYYCPVSLLRVHGTTMMEEFRHQEEIARGEDDFAEPIEEAGEPVTTAVPVAEESAAHRTPEISEELKEAESPPSGESESERKASLPEESSTQPVETHESGSLPAKSPTEIIHTSILIVKESPGPNSGSHSQPSPENSGTPSSNTSAKASSSLSGSVKHSDQVASLNSSIVTPTATEPSQNASAVSATSDSSSAIKTHGNETVHGSSGNNSSAKASSASGDQASSHSQGRTASSQTQPPPSNPTTQESFFKSIHKRLQQLESNSTLSLQYIEEQSRILRDAFMKVEKRQLGKTEHFLQHLNASVVAELKVYRMQYDQLWQSTILELESHREQYEREIGAISTRLTLLADELVFQKRMAVVQSTLLLLCLGLVLFVRSGTLGTQLDTPIVQQMVGSANTHIGRIFDTPPGSPESARRVRGFRNMWRGDTGGSTRGSGSGHQSDLGFDRRGHLSSDGETDGGRSPVHFEFEPATPPSATLEGGAAVVVSGSSEGLNSDQGEDVDGVEVERKIVLATQSGPATPRGTRDCKPSWEVDSAVGMLKASDAAGRKRSPLRRSHSYGNDGDENKENYRKLGPQDEEEDSGPGSGEDLLGF